MHTLGSLEWIVMSCECLQAMRIVVTITAVGSENESGLDQDSIYNI